MTYQSGSIVKSQFLFFSVDAFNSCSQFKVNITSLKKIFASNQVLLSFCCHYIFGKGSSIIRQHILCWNNNDFSCEPTLPQRLSAAKTSWPTSNDDDSCFVAWVSFHHFGFLEFDYTVSRHFNIKFVVSLDDLESWNTIYTWIVLQSTSLNAKGSTMPRTDNFILMKHSMIKRSSFVRTWVSSGIQFSIIFRDKHIVDFGIEHLHFSFFKISCKRDFKFLHASLRFSLTFHHCH